MASPIGWFCGWFNWLVHMVDPNGSIGWFDWLIQLVYLCDLPILLGCFAGLIIVLVYFAIIP